MKKIHYIVLGVIILGGIGLYMNKNNNSHLPHTHPHTHGHDTHNTESNINTYTGTYDGELPCASCSGIMTTLTLEKDQSFVLLQEYQEIEESSVESNGAYTIEGNIITTTDSEGSLNFFQAEENQLRMLDQNQQMVTGELADNYILIKK